MSSREDSVTGLMAQYLRQNEIDANTFEGLEIPQKGIKEPDFAIKSGGKYYGEAKWKSEYNQGIVDATEYREAPIANGTFAIAYPDDLKDEIKQKTLTNNVEPILSGYNYPVTFLSDNGDTDMQKVSIDELPDWLNKQFDSKNKTVTDTDEVVSVLRQAANILTDKAPEVDAVDLFENVLGVEAEEDEKLRAAKQVVGYLLINQIVFYRVLSAKTKYEPIDADSLSSPSDLLDYFNPVLDKDYTPIFGISVAEMYSQEHLPAIKEAIRSTYVINPDQVRHEVLGDIFHTLIPQSLRKKVAAYYTQNKAAHLLAGIAINSGDDTVIDLACGTGTLLSSSYRIKKSYKETFSQFGREEHKQFLEEDITGIDIMPFAAHLATIHLALQNPQYESDKIKIGIEDSTKLQPRDEISPLSKVLPENKIQQTFDSIGKSISDYKEEELVERGRVARKGMEQEPLNLDEPDLVLMNPPYSRSEVMSKFSDNYKNKLKQNRLRQYQEYIDGRMNFYGYFILLADRFLDQKDRIAAVTSVGLLINETDRGVRELLNKKYSIEYIFIRDDSSDFSEDTDRREIMTVAKKGGQADTKYIRLNTLDVDYKAIESSATELTSGEKLEREKFSIKKIEDGSLNFDNLFAPFAVQNPNLVQLLEEVLDSDKISTIEDLDAGIIRGIQAGAYDPRGYNPEMTIHSPSVCKFGDRDVWILDEKRENKIVAQHRLVDEKFEIPLENTVMNMRRFTERWKADVTKLEEYAVVEKFDGFDRFEQLTKQEDIPVKDWSSRVDSRLSNVAVMRRADFSSQGTAHFAYYSENERLYPGTMWVLTELNPVEAKLTTAFLDSIVGWLQFLVNRIETRGAYAEWHKYMINIIRVANPGRLNQDSRDQIIECLEEYSQIEVGSVVEQLAAVVPKTKISHQRRNKLKEIFDISFDNKLPERRKLDRSILDSLGFNGNIDQRLNKLYIGMLKEIELLKRMMDS